MTLPALTFEYISHSPEQTRQYAAALGRQLEAGDIMALTGRLGSGKTVFAQGVSRGLDVPSAYYITSPTYNLINEYPGRCPFYHLDLYRIDGAADPEDLGLDELLYGAGVCVIEWPDRLPPGVLQAWIDLRIEDLGQNRRRLSGEVTGSALAARLNFLTDYVN